MSHFYFACHGMGGMALAAGGALIVLAGAWQLPLHLLTWDQNAQYGAKWKPFWPTWYAVQQYLSHADSWSTQPRWNMLATWKDTTHVMSLVSGIFPSCVAHMGVINGQIKYEACSAYTCMWSWKCKEFAALTNDWNSWQQGLWRARLAKSNQAWHKSKGFLVLEAMSKQMW